MNFILDIISALLFMSVIVWLVCLYVALPYAGIMLLLTFL